VIKGKRGYMSPEQCRGDAVDRRSDVFGLGILLWELTVGQRLFGGDSDYAAMSKIVFGMVPDPRQIVPGYPSELAEIAMRALQRDAENRPHTAQALALELEHFVQSMGLRTSTHLVAEFIAAHFGTMPQPTLVPRPAVDEEAATRHVDRPIPPRRLPRLPFAIAAVAVLGGLGGWFLRPASERAPDPSPQIAAPAAASPTASVVPTPTPRVADELAASPDDVLVADDEGDPIVIDDTTAETTPGKSRKPRPAPVRDKPESVTAPRSPDPGAPVPSRPNELFPPRE
jgi:serine/threonine protein kinase